MLMKNSQSGNHPTNSELLETIIGRHMAEIARGASLVRQRSMILSVSDDRRSVDHVRDQFEKQTANYITGIHKLARAHGLDPLRGLGLVDCELIRLAVAPLDRVQNPFPVPAGRHPLDTFTDDRLVEALRELHHALGSWDWLADTNSPYEYSPEEAGALVLDRLAKATAALERREEAAS